jgi:uncharacterized protein (DUF305 family)
MLKRMAAFLGVALMLSACDSGGRDEATGVSNEGQGAAAPTSAAPTTGEVRAASYDLRFIDTINAHHDHGIQMARMAVDKASSTEVREMAQTMIADQEKDKAELRAWRDQWFSGSADAHDMSLPGASSMNMDMSRLQSPTGHAFDHAFLEMMVPHHEGAIAMGRDAAANAEHEELRRKGQEIADKQQREIEDIKKMQASLAAH